MYDVARTIVVGDVHGCRAELEALLEACKRRDADDVVFVGDLVAKGPDSAGVVAIARQLGAFAVMGNHDQRVVDWHRAVTKKKAPPSLPADHQRVVTTLTDADFRYLRDLPYWLEIEQHGAVVVHAGLVPGVPLGEQKMKNLITMRTLQPNGKPSPRLHAGVLWGSRWPGPSHVYFGHDAVSGLQIHSHATGLDTGCVYGKQLTACILPEGRLVSVDAARAYAQTG